MFIFSLVEIVYLRLKVVFVSVVIELLVCKVYESYICDFVCSFRG